MRRYISTACLLLTALSISLTGCIKDSCKSNFTYTYYVPVYKTGAEIRANIKSNAPRAIEKPGKLFIHGSYIFLNEVDKGVHIINNANPASPQNIAFIDIPGNMDIAVKGNTMFADLYTDLIAIDISNPLNVTVNKTVEKVFPHRNYGIFVADSTRFIAQWVRKDTVVMQDCSNNRRGWWEDNKSVYINYSAASTTGSGSASVSPYGVGGSMARFSVVNDRLYTVGLSELNVFNISTTSDPSFVKRSHVGMNIETIFPFRDQLFIGSSNGMFIFNISSPDNPSRTGQFSHVRSCDPVIADDQFAYVTLRSGNDCAGFTNQMEVLKLNDLTNPSLEKVYPLSNPHGLSKDGNILFLCDGRDGLKVYDATDARNLQLTKHITGLDTYDVIAWNGVALVVAKDGLYQYSYTDRNNIRLLSRMGISRP
jgi:hypothetical protein